MKAVIFFLLGPVLVFILFSLYGSFVHNQHFSEIAIINKKVHAGDKCDAVYLLLEEYRRSAPEEIFLGNSNRVWEHKPNITSTIELNDLSTIFDNITYYVFCNDKGYVVETLLVGD